jgi:hypothetical protein
MIFHLSLWNVEKMLKKKEKEEIHGSLRQRQRPTGMAKKSRTESFTRHSMPIRIPWSNRRCEASGEPAHRWYRR